MKKNASAREVALPVVAASRPPPPHRQRRARGRSSPPRRRRHAEDAGGSRRGRGRGAAAVDLRGKEEGEDGDCLREEGGVRDPEGGSW